MHFEEQLGNRERGNDGDVWEGYQSEWTDNSEDQVGGQGLEPVRMVIIYIDALICTWGNWGNMDRLWRVHPYMQQSPLVIDSPSLELIPMMITVTLDSVLGALSNIVINSYSDTFPRNLPCWAAWMREFSIMATFSGFTSFIFITSLSCMFYICLWLRASIFVGGWIAEFLLAACIGYSLLFFDFFHLLFVGLLTTLH